MPNAIDVLIRQLTTGTIEPSSAFVRGLLVPYDDEEGTLETGMAKKQTIGALFDLAYALRGLLIQSNLLMNGPRLAGRSIVGEGELEEIVAGEGLVLENASLKAEVTPAILTQAVDNLLAALALKAPLESPALTGEPTAPTAPTNSVGQQVANAEFVAAKINALIGGSPALLDTLAELAAALGNDANFAATITAALAQKAALVHNHTTAQLPMANANEAVTAAQDNRVLSPLNLTQWYANRKPRVVTGDLTCSTEVPATPASYTHSAGWYDYSVEIYAGDILNSTIVSDASGFVSWVNSNYYGVLNAWQNGEGVVFIETVATGSSATFRMNGNNYYGQDASVESGIVEIGEYFATPEMPLHVWVYGPVGTQWSDLYLEAYLPGPGWVPVKYMPMGNLIEGVTDALVSWTSSSFADETFPIMAMTACYGLRVRCDTSPSNGGPLRIGIITMPVS